MAPAAAALLAALVAGGLLWWFADDDEGFVLSAAPTAPPVSGMSATPTDTSSTPPAGVAALAPSDPSPGPSVTVHVAGAVATPGVVVVPGGSRVIEAVAAAGGLTAAADADTVNLARQVLDGELVVVPTPGQVAAAPLAPGAGGGPGGGAGGTAGSSGGLVDVNRADATQLDALPGIGPVLAQRIISYRVDTGPFTTIEDLRSVPGIGEKVFGGIRDLVVV